MSTPSNPTAIVTYSHSDPGWGHEQEETRSQYVVRLVALLRDHGIDADADIFHQNEDWTRWGPRQVAECDFVLIVVSKAWQQGWAGSGDPQMYRGTRAEADAVRSIQAAGHDRLQERCRVILLPDSGEADIPTGMHGLNRHHVRELTPHGIESLLRDLTNQPKYVKGELGPIPPLPPALTSPTPDAAGGAPDPRTPAERAESLRGQLAALPLPLPGEGPHLPWYRLRTQLEALLAAEVGAMAEGDAPSGVDWQPHSGVTVNWMDQWRAAPTYQSALVALHLIPLPVQQLSQRMMDSLEDPIAEVMRRIGGLRLAQGMTVRRDGRDVVVEPEVPDPRLDEVHGGQVLGTRVEKSCQVSVWHSLPRDHMGSVLDLDKLTADVRRAIDIGAPLIRRTVPPAERVLVAAELAQTTMLTRGTLASLGHRSSTTLAMGPPPRMEPDESVPVGALEGTFANEVAGTVAGVLFRAWNR